MPDPCTICAAMAARRSLLAAWAPVVEAAGRFRDDRSEANADAVVKAYENVRPILSSLAKPPAIPATSTR